MKLSVPQLCWHGDTELELEFPSAWDVSLCAMRGHHNPKLTGAEFEHAFSHPICSAPIREAAQGKKEVALLFDDMSAALEAGRRIMTRRLDPFVIRLYDPASTASRVKKILGYEYDGSYMVIGFDGDPDIAALQEEKALAICAEFGAQDLGREPGEKWWEQRYDFYYPPQNLKLPWMYGTTETITTYDNIEVCRAYQIESSRGIKRQNPDLNHTTAGKLG